MELNDAKKNSWLFREIKVIKVRGLTVWLPYFLCLSRPMPFSSLTTFKEMCEGIKVADVKQV